MNRLLSASVWALLTAMPMSATVASEPPRPTHPCAAMQDAVERLDCYDQAFERPDSDETHPAAVKVAEDFGFSEVEKRARDPDHGKRDAADQMEAIVAEVGYMQGTRKMIVTLDNGQIWLQSEALTSGRLRAGDRVTIRKAALGSYQLLTPGRIAVRVRRLR